MVARAPRFRLYLITDRRLVQAGDIIRTCEEVLADEEVRAADPALQLRDKDLEAGALLDLARRLRSLCSRYQVPLLVNDRIDIALAADADGVHLPANSFHPSDARKLLGPRRLVGVSTHSAEEIVAAGREGADFAVFGPVFTPISKSGYGEPRGVEKLATAARISSIPIFALGGITAERVAEVAESGPAGVALIGAVFAAENPRSAARTLARALRAQFADWH